MNDDTEDQSAVERVLAMAEHTNDRDHGSEQYEFRRRAARHVRATVMLRELSEHQGQPDHLSINRSSDDR